MSKFSDSLHDNHRKWGKIELIILSVVLIGISLSHCTNTGSTLNQAEAAYKNTNCQQAIKLFTKVIDSSALTENEIARAKAQKAECELFQAGVNAQAKGSLTKAAQSYISFLESYSNSPLSPVVRQKTSSLLQPSNLNKVVQPSICDRLDLILQNQLLPEPQKNLPLYYQACGQVYTKNGQYNQAIAAYENFLQNYPQHSLAPNIKTALARVLLAAARTGSGGTISRPRATGRASRGSTVVFIRNDSPQEMQIVFSGSQPRFEKLQPCQDCQIHFGTPPKTCPGKGPLGRYILKPGMYDVVVKSTGGRVRPFKGQWDLQDATEYSHCFYIVRGLTPPSNQVPRPIYKVPKPVYPNSFTPSLRS